MNPLRRRGSIAAAVAAAAALAITTAAPAMSNPGNNGNARSSSLSATNGQQVNDAAARAPHLANQELDWETCTFPGLAAATVERLQRVQGLACADVTVPRDWNNPNDGNTITVRVSKTETSAGNPNRQGIALVNPGGPGGSGLPWGAAMAERDPQLAAEFDFVGFDPRGVGESTQLVCEYTPNAAHDMWEDMKAQVDGCLENPLTPFITTEQTVYDMDLIRVLMGEDHISYVGFSYGTWLGTWYQRVFPQNSHRFLLDSAVDMSRDGLQTTWDLQPRSRDRQFQDMMLPWMARQDDLFGLGADPMNIRERWENVGGTRTQLGYQIAAGYVLPAMYNTASYPLAGSMVRAYIIVMENDMARQAAANAEVDVDAVLPKVIAEARAALGAEHHAAFDRMVAEAKTISDAQGSLASASLSGQPVTFSGTFSAIRCQDGQWNHSKGYWTSWVNDLVRKSPWIGVLMGPAECMYWPAQTSMPQQPGGQRAQESIVVQSELDAATPYEAGHRSASVLRNTALISVDNEGSHGLYPYGTECVDAPIRTYFLTGQMPAEKTLCNALPLPFEAQSFQVAGTPTHKGDIKISMRTDAVREANRITEDAMQRELLDARQIVPDVEAFLNN